MAGREWGLRSAVLKVGFCASSIRTTWELVRSADSQGPAGCFNKLQADSDARSSVKAAELANSPQGRKKSGRQ